MIDKTDLLEKLDECVDNIENKVKYWREHGDMDEFYYYQGYAEGADDVAMLIREMTNDKH